jgi:hypothetical protein
VEDGIDQEACKGQGQEYLIGHKRNTHLDDIKTWQLNKPEED